MYLKQIRNELGVTQVKLAEKLGYSSSHCIKVEGGYVKPSYDFLKAVFDLMDGKVDMNEFFK